MRQALEDIFPAERVRTSPEDLGVWGVDWTRSFPVAPGAVVFPETVEEVVAVTRLANEAGFALVPSGGRTGLSGGAVASNGEVVVSFDRMNRVLDFNPVDRVVRCEAGVVTATLQEYAAERGLFYPVDFASSGSSQVGGNIATNAGGIKVIRYGLTRDWIAGLRVVTGAGEVLDCNNGLVKNATGYDLRHLFIGAEGTLGFVVEADIRLLEAPPPQRVMVLGVERISDMLDVLRSFQAAVTLSAFEFFSESALQHVLAHRDVPRPFASRAPYYALLEFDAAGEEAALDTFEATVAAGWVGDGVVSRSDAQAQALWTLREGISESIAPRTPYKNDLSVRISDVPEFLDENRPDGRRTLPGPRGLLVRPYRRREPAPQHPETRRPLRRRFLRTLPPDQPGALRGGARAPGEHLGRARRGAPETGLPPVLALPGGDRADAEREAGVRPQRRDEPRQAAGDLTAIPSAVHYRLRTLGSVRAAGPHCHSV